MGALQTVTHAPNKANPTTIAEGSLCRIPRATEGVGFAQIRSAPTGTTSAPQTAGPAQGKPQPIIWCLPTGCSNKLPARELHFSTRRSLLSLAYEGSPPSLHLGSPHDINSLSSTAVPPGYLPELMLPPQSGWRQNPSFKTPEQQLTFGPGQRLTEDIT